MYVYRWNPSKNHGRVASGPVGLGLRVQAQVKRIQEEVKKQERWFINVYNVYMAVYVC